MITQNIRLIQFRKLTKVNLKSPEYIIPKDMLPKLSPAQLAQRELSAHYACQLTSLSPK